MYVKCFHLGYSVKITKRTYTDGSIHYIPQCLRCGEIGNAIPHAKAHALCPDGYFPEFDDRLREPLVKESRNISLFDDN